MATKQTMTMTASELLAKDNYAVCRFIDGEYAWLVGVWASLSKAEEQARDYRSSTKGDYRVVMIAKP